MDVLNVWRPNGVI